MNNLELVTVFLLFIILTTLALSIRITREKKKAIFLFENINQEREEAVESYDIAFFYTKILSFIAMALFVVLFFNRNIF